MLIVNRESFEEVLKVITKEDRDYILIRHILGAKEIVKPHYHPQANEWVIAKQAEFLQAETLHNGQIIYKIWLGRKEAGSLLLPIVAVCIPYLTRHTLVALSKVSYFVLRDKKDKIIYCK